MQFVYGLFDSKNSVLLRQFQRKHKLNFVPEIAHTVFDSKTSENAFFSVTQETENIKKSAHYKFREKA